MTQPGVTFIYEPPRVDQGANPAGPERHQRFAKELASHLGGDVQFVHGFMREMLPPDGFILLASFVAPQVVIAECDGPLQSGIPARLFPIGISRTRIFENVLEPLSLAGAIDGLSLVEWAGDDPEAIGARGLHGRKDVAQVIGARCQLFESRRYCYLTSAKHRGLPHLLADYIQALRDCGVSPRERQES